MTRNPSSPTPAGIGIRTAAYLVDYIVVALYGTLLGVVSLALSAAGVSVGAWFTHSPLTGQLTAFTLLTLPVVCYFALTESSPWQGSLGKRVLRLGVVDAATGGRLPRARAFARAAVKFVPWELAHTFLWRIEGWPAAAIGPSTGVWLGFGVVWLLVLVYLLGAAFDRRHRAPYDRVAGSEVVRRRR